jgi:hypothetical protein
MKRHVASDVNGGYLALRMVELPKSLVAERTHPYGGTCRAALSNRAHDPSMRNRGFPGNLKVADYDG